MNTHASLASFNARSIDGQEVPLASYKGQVVLIVNVASKCGFTAQYEGLEALYQKFKAQGFTILGFPCNQFGAQEPGTESDIKSFCTLQYGVSFPLFSKIEVNGENSHPLYAWLKSNCPGILGTEAIKWNFTKFLIGKDGLPKARFAPQTTPQDLELEISPLLKLELPLAN